MKLSVKGLSLLIVIVLLISATAGYSMYSKFNEMEQSIYSLESQLETAKEQLYEANKELESLKQKNEEITGEYERKIASNQSYIDDLEDRLERLTGQPVMPKDKTVYLTFDDGPSFNTNKVLDILNEYNVKGSFFVVGRNDPKSLDIYKRIVEEGHALGNHTYSHIYKNIYSNVDIFMSDIYRLENLIYEATEYETRLFRFPGGSSTKHLENSKYKPFINRLLNEGYQYFDWNVDSGDALQNPLNASEIIQRTITNARKQKHAIVLMHEKETTLEALPIIIEYLKDLGYKFERLTLDSFYVHHRE
ncbi:MAG: polysaccharide deacetylase family protein [Clostridia bacterium]